jgi:hypothetical protein
MPTRGPQTKAERKLWHEAQKMAQEFLGGQRVFDPADVRGVDIVATVGGNQRMIAEIRECQQDAEDSRAFRDFRRMARCNRGVL